MTMTIDAETLEGLKSTDLDEKRAAFTAAGELTTKVLTRALEEFGTPFAGQTISKEPVRFGKAFKTEPAWRTAKVHAGGVLIAVSAQADEDAAKTPCVLLHVTVTPARRGPGALLEQHQAVCDALRGLEVGAAGWFELWQPRTSTPTLSWARTLTAGVYLARSKVRGNSLTLDDGAIARLASGSRPLLLACMAEHRAYHQQAFARLNALVPQAVDAPSQEASAKVLVEREEVVDALVAAIAQRPLVLLAGVSGSGKTQLACRVAWARSHGHFAPLGETSDGVSFVTRTRRQLMDAGVVTNADEAGWVTLPPVDEGARDSGLLGAGSEDDGDETTPSEAELANEDDDDDIDGSEGGDGARNGATPEWSTPWELVSVRPDWHEAANLWGWRERDQFHGTRALRVVLHAWLKWRKEQTRVSHVLVLDEMNLSRLEYYGSDLLSAMERPGFDVIALHDSGRPLPLSGFPGVMVPERIGWAPGLTVVGTVNVDETTFAFAPKVLDRAAVLEFLDVDLERAFRLWNREAEWAALGPWLSGVQAILRPHALHLGYRAAKEIADTLVAHLGPVATWPSLTRESPFCRALDRQLLSKVLPRVRGPRGTSEPVLRELLVFAVAGSDEDARAKLRKELPALDERIAFDANAVGARLADATFPAAAAKVRVMLERLEGIGFASFF